MKDETTKTVASQAWRKKPRQFAPKSRLGCKTCKIRRVKCDLAQPSCSKCRSTGRTCDGYSNVLPTPVCIAPPMQNLRPFMVLPETGSAQTEAISFFEYISIKHLDEYHPSAQWRETLMFFSQTVPAVRHAAVALALLQRDFRQYSSDKQPDDAALIHYNRAIQLLLKQTGSDSIETIAVTLLVCYLFTCFDQLASNYIQSVNHLRGGVQLLRNFDNDHPGRSESHVLVSQVARQIRRLDRQAVAFLTDWTPTEIQDTLVSPLHASNGAFQSLDQAADQLQILVARVMHLFYEGQKSALTGTPAPPLSVVDMTREQLAVWSSLFKNTLVQDGILCSADADTRRLVSLLRLQHTILWTLVNTAGPGREMDYDEFLPEFQQCAALAREVAAAHVKFSGSLQLTFTPEVGILPVLYILGVKCRHPLVRREALAVLRRKPMREAVWDSISAAKVVERIIEIEEGEGASPQDMGEIPAWRRVESVSWQQVPGDGRSAGRLDIAYSFCGGKGVQFETLLL